LSTVNAGSPNDSEQPTGDIPWLALLMGLIAVIFVALIGPRLVGILFAIMAPPEPPVPGSVRLLGYSREVYGTDTWRYDTQADVCELVTFYLEQGGVCPVMPPRCAPDSSSDPSEEYIAMCSGDRDFSIFAMRWRFTVPLRTAPARLQFELAREIFWTGDLPPPQP
jgi:hypothetical protein